MAKRGSGQQATKPKFTQEDYKYIITKLLKTPEGNIKKEGIPARILLSRYPNMSFWRFFELDYKLNSLWFLVNDGDGKDLINKIYAMYNYKGDSIKSYEQDCNNFKRKTPRKPRSLVDFLK